MANNNEQNLPKLETCLQQIHQIFNEEKRKFEQKISMLEKEKSTLFSLLENKTELEKENENLKTEIKSSKEELGVLLRTANENHSKHLEMRQKYKFLKRNVTKKQSEWSRFLQIVQKQCHCKFKEKITMDVKVSDNSMHSPIMKPKSVSNVFFMSPEKSKLNISDITALAPMTEQYNEIVSPNASTPLIVGETEKNLILGDDNDCELMSSPTLVDDKGNHYLRSTAEQKDEQQNLKNKSYFVKPFPLDEFTMDKQDNIETSAELFSDNSLLIMDENKDEFNQNSVSLLPTKCHENIDSYEINKFIYRENMKTYKETVDIQKNTFKKVSFSEITGSLCKNGKYVPGEFTQNTGSVNAQVLNDTHDTKNVPNRKMDVSGNMKICENVLTDLDDHKNVEGCYKYSTVIKDTDDTTNLPNRKTDVSGNPKIFENVMTDVDNHKNVGCYKYSTVVKKRADRAKLNGYACDECKRYYDGDDLSKKQLEEVLKRCSRHKHAFSPPKTPDQFWSIGFPNTQDYIDKGCMLDENETLPDHAKPKWKKGKKRKAIKYQ